MSIKFKPQAPNTKKAKNLNFYPTLNFWTSSGLAILPSETQVWKNEGATDTPENQVQLLMFMNRGRRGRFILPKASADIPVLARSEFVCITRKVPISSTSKCCE